MKIFQFFLNNISTKKYKRGTMEDKNTKYQKTIEKLGIYIKKEKRANKISFILLISFILGIIGTFVIVSLNYLILIAN